MKMLRLVVVMTVLCGVLYPLAVTLIGQVFFRQNANGSLVMLNDKVVGSRLIAQKTEGSQWFHPRPSAGDYDTVSSSASQYSPTHKRGLEEIAERKHQLPQAGLDAWTTSASGLDPDITPESALAQASRIALARQLDLNEINSLIKEHTLKPTWGIWGRDRVNVLELNLALAQRGQHAQLGGQTP